MTRNARLLRLSGVLAVVAAGALAVLPATAVAHSGACIEYVNPHGKTIPPAGWSTLPGPKGGQNDDGFYRLSISDTPATATIVFDLGGGVTFDTGTFGPVNVKWTQAPGARPTVKKIGSTTGRAGAVQYHVISPNEVTWFSSADPGFVFTCLVPPPPK